MFYVKYKIQSNFQSLRKTDGLPMIHQRSHLCYCADLSLSYGLPTDFTWIPIFRKGTAENPGI